MAEIIPALTKEVLARMTAGEKRFAQRLKDLLEDDYLVWYDIPVGRERHYPDRLIKRIDAIVSANPRYGSRSGFLAQAALDELNSLHS